MTKSQWHVNSQRQPLYKEIKIIWQTRYIWDTCIYHEVYPIRINQDHISCQWRKRVSALKLSGRELRVDKQMIVAYSVMKQSKNQLILKCTRVKRRSAKIPGETWPV